VATLDNLETIVQNINDNLVPRYGSGAPSNNAVYEGQIYIDNATGDVYIATATGGGPADWVQLAYQSAIPATPSLDDVLLVGNTSTTSVVIQDLLVAPTQTNTMMSDGNELSDTTQGFITNYHINDIYVTDTVTSDFLQIAIDNTQNQTITFPDTSGQLALLSDTQLSLQNVTDNGNLTNDPIFADSFSSTPTYLSNFASLLGYVGDGTTAHGALQLKEDSDGTGFSSTITADIDLTADRTISIPDADGTMVLSVNGNIPDNQGNVVVAGLPTTSTLQDVLTNGASSTGIDMEIVDAVISVYDTGVVNSISLDGTTGSVSITTGGGTGVITATNLTDLRSFELPDASGTLALTSSVTLQSITAGTSRDLINGINLQGTNAGSGQTGILEVIGIGTNAAQNNSGNFTVFIGPNAGQGNTGSSMIGIGNSATQNNSGNTVIGIGYGAMGGNTGNQVIGIGQNAGNSNSGLDVVAIGINAGQGNTLSAMTIFSNSSLPSYLNFAVASASINIGTGASSGSTYLYHDQTTNSIGAVRIP